jgi:hypothetical protein
MVIDILLTVLIIYIAFELLRLLIGILLASCVGASVGFVKLIKKVF